MLYPIVKIATLLLLVILFYEDIRYRSISIHWIALAFLGVLGLAYMEAKLNWVNILVNISFVAIQVIFISLYLMLKRKSIRDIFKNYIGVGDIVFWIIPAFYLDPIVYVFYALFCYLSILIVFGVIMAIRKRSVTVPLAGFMAMVLGLYIACEWYGISVGYWINGLIIQ